METATSSPENRRYNDESNYLDGLYEFHPEFFKELAQEDLKTLQEYYLIGKALPENVFVHRRELTEQQPKIEHKAREAFSKLLKIAGAEEFHYSHD
jgi:asparagine synthetase A